MYEDNKKFFKWQFSFFSSFFSSLPFSRVNGETIMDPTTCQLVRPAKFDQFEDLSHYKTFPTLLSSYPQCARIPIPISKNKSETIRLVQKGPYAKRCLKAPTYFDDWDLLTQPYYNLVGHYRQMYGVCVVFEWNQYYSRLNFDDEINRLESHEY